MGVILYNIYHDKLSKKDGFYQLTIDSFEEFLNLIRPDKYNMRELMTHLKYNVEPPEKIDLGHLGLVPSPPPTISDEIIFRGHADSKWLLTPSFFRDGNIGYHISPRDILRKEYEHLIEFQKLCDLSGVQIPGDSHERRTKQQEIINSFDSGYLGDFWHDDFIEIGAFAQHFGVQTSFLDWSRHILTACYFACVGAMEDYLKSHNLVEFFSIFILNNKYLDHNFIKNIEPPKSLNNHISHQQGLLTLTKMDTNIIGHLSANNNRTTIDSDLSLENVLKFYKKDHLLIKINVPAIFASDLFEHCNAYNFNACNLFRGINGTVQHFNNLKTYEKFMQKLDDELKD